jgi:hypothetical protein
VVVATLLRYLWASPASAIGVAAAFPLWAFGARGAVRSGVLEVTLQSRNAGLASNLLPFQAITLGHVVIATGELHQESLRAHERVHVKQYEHWGPVFLLAYPAESLFQLLRGRRPYLDNRFELQARELSETHSIAPRLGDA